MTSPEIKALTKQMMDGFLSVCESSTFPEPRALVIMGQPGSGVFKAASRLQREYFTRDGEWERPAIVCEENFRYRGGSVGSPPANHSDTTKKEMLRDARALERSCIKVLAAAGRNMLLFARSDNCDTTPEILKIIKKAGYSVEVVALAVPGKISATRTIFECEWLKRKTGMTFLPLAGWYRDSLHCIAQITLRLRVTSSLTAYESLTAAEASCTPPISSCQTRKRGRATRYCASSRGR
ncbi:MAG: zeta toxin family protein [Synergistaceae bacterium]|jgi:hypothetical protein|nr:zeta toxin family protein [Synergistaceae bacterium]